MGRRKGPTCRELYVTDCNFMAEKGKCAPVRRTVGQAGMVLGQTDMDDGNTRVEALALHGIGRCESGTAPVFL